MQLGLLLLVSQDVHCKSEELVTQRMVYKLPRESSNWNYWDKNSKIDQEKLPKCVHSHSVKTSNKKECYNETQNLCPVTILSVLVHCGVATVAITTTDSSVQICTFMHPASGWQPLSSTVSSLFRMSVRDLACQDGFKLASLKCVLSVTLMCAQLQSSTAPHYSYCIKIKMTKGMSSCLYSSKLQWLKTWMLKTQKSHGTSSENCT